jgi:hypothetical protein
VSDVTAIITPKAPPELPIDIALSERQLSAYDTRPTPVIIILRDRLSYALKCRDALLRAGQNSRHSVKLHIVDHGSTYPPCLDWLDYLEEHWPVTRTQVHRLGDAHPRDLWTHENGDFLRRIVGDRRYVVTDPDVVPDEYCPPGWLDYLHQVLNERLDRVKVGLGLRTDDLPERYVHRDTVRAWEAQWHKPLPDAPHLHAASVDTTLALYRPLWCQPTFALDPALRTGPPYLARHLTWYEDSANPSEEATWYREHVARTGLPPSHWLDPEAFVRSEGGT